MQSIISLHAKFSSTRLKRSANRNDMNEGSQVPLRRSSEFQLHLSSFFPASFRRKWRNSNVTSRSEKWWRGELVDPLTRERLAFHLERDADFNKTLWVLWSRWQDQSVRGISKSEFPRTKRRITSGNVCNTLQRFDRFDQLKYTRGSRQWTDALFR